MSHSYDPSSDIGPHPTGLFRRLFRPARAAAQAERTGRERGLLVKLTIDGPILEIADRRTRLPPFLSMLPFLRPAQHHLGVSVARVRELATEIARDRRVEGLLVEVQAASGGAAAFTSLREALARVRARGKKLVFYLPEGGGSRELLLASAGTHVVMAKESTIAPLGVAVESRYLRRALDKIGILPEVFARGNFKTAGESLARDSMSREQREQLEALLEVLHRELVTALADGRGVNEARALRWIDESPYRAPDALAERLIDAIGYADDIENLERVGEPASMPDTVPDQAGAQSRAPARTVPAGRYLRRRKALRLAVPKRKHIGVVVVRGPIVSRAPLPLSHMAVDRQIAAALGAARDDAHVEGLIVFIDSPGGTALASDHIHHELSRVAAKKPVVACFGNVAASGGYYIAQAAHAIVAQPTCITGSIGVVAAHLVFEPLLDKLGIATELVKRGAHAGMLSVSRRLDDSARAALDREIDGSYRAFVDVVANGRRRPAAEIEPLARGRIYSGKDALACGLIDALGGFDRATDEVRERIGPSGRRLEPRRIRGPRALPQMPRIPAPFVRDLVSLLESLGPGARHGTALEMVVEAASLALAAGPADRVLAWDPRAVTAV